MCVRVRRWYGIRVMSVWGKERREGKLEQDRRLIYIQYDGLFSIVRDLDSRVVLLNSRASY